MGVTLIVNFLINFTCGSWWKIENGDCVTFKHWYYQKCETVIKSLYSNHIGGGLTPELQGQL